MKCRGEGSPGGTQGQRQVLLGQVGTWSLTRALNREMTSDFCSYAPWAAA